MCNFPGPAIGTLEFRIAILAQSCSEDYEKRENQKEQGR
jgi:hypothetical protein